MVGELTSSLLSEAFAPIARTCESYCTSIAARLPLVSFRVEVGRYSNSKTEEGAQRLGQVKSRSKVTSN
jgi:hypothetical protein